MPKRRRIVCPECGHRHTIQIGAQPGRSIGVRAKRITGNQFEYTITQPGEMIEADHFTSLNDDLILTAAFGLAVGSMCGFCASLIAPDYAIQIIMTGASGGVTIAWGWLLAETNQRLRRILPWFIEQRQNWPLTPGLPTNNNITLTVDHRYRDGTTESGRTINYFGTLPVEVERFTQYATDILTGQSLAIAHWTGAGKLFSRSEYEKLLTTLHSAGTVINQPGKGNILTLSGKRALYRHLKDHQPPSPITPQEYANA